MSVAAGLLVLACGSSFAGADVATGTGAPGGRPDTTSTAAGAAAPPATEPAAGAGGPPATAPGEDTATARAKAPPDPDAAGDPATATESASALNQELVNPVGGLWSLQSQFNNFRLDNGRWNDNWNFQPTLPISLTGNWNLITRPVMPLYNIVPHATSSGEVERTAGLGDLILAELLSPAQSGNWFLGAGPTFVFPTATSRYTGQGKVQMGPAATVGYRTSKYIVGLFPQQWFSIAGDPGRPDTNQFNLQPIAAVFFGDGWNFGYYGNILADWKAPSGEVWTLPIGFNVGKVVRFGSQAVKFQFSVQYMPVHPDEFGQEWNFQVMVTPIIPKLIKGNLFG